MTHDLCGKHGAVSGRRVRSFASRYLLGATLSAVAATGSMANPKAEACASGPSANQGLIYRTVRPEVTPSADLTPLIRARVIALVQAGRIPHASAPDDAQIAARCLRLLQS
jgi:hypothetical protein